MKIPVILIVVNDHATCHSLTSYFRNSEILCLWTQDILNACRILNENEIKIVFLDFDLADNSAANLAEDIRIGHCGRQNQDTILVSLAQNYLDHHWHNCVRNNFSFALEKPVQYNQIDSILQHSMGLPGQAKNRSSNPGKRSFTQVRKRDAAFFKLMSFN